MELCSNLWVDDYYWVGFLSINDLDALGEFFGLISLYFAYEMIDDYHNGYLVDLILYRIFPYFNPFYNTFLASPEKLAAAIKSNFNKYYQPDVDCLANYQIVDDELYFESWVGGKIKGWFGRGINNKELQKLPENIQEQIIPVIHSLKNPFQTAAIKLKNMENTFRVRVGDYRILFKVYSSEKIVVIIKISHRKKAYR